MGSEQCGYTNGHASLIAPLRFQPVDDGEGGLYLLPSPLVTRRRSLMPVDQILAVRGIRGALGVSAGRIPDEL